MRRARQSGVTLIELMIAITLVSLLATSLLMAMRTGFLTYQKTSARLELDRRVMSVEQILGRELSGVMPEMSDCATAAGGAGRVPFFLGGPESMRLISSYSMQDGARGAPRVLVLQVVPSEKGGVRLIVNESLASGPSSTLPFCLDGKLVPPPPGEKSFVLADKLASCQFSYLERIELTNQMNWKVAWDRPNLPSGIRVEMTPLAPDPGRLPLMSVTVPIRVNRDVQGAYADQ